MEPVSRYPTKGDDDSGDELCAKVLRGTSACSDSPPCVPASGSL